MSEAENVDRFFVVTGGPGSGKSSLIDQLEKCGYARTVEAGRSIIQEQVAIGASALPWQDRHLFSELMLSWEIRSYREAENSTGQVFFDRGVPDVLAYLRLIGVPAPKHMRNAAQAFRYHPRVFIAPPWREIFAQDSERKQDFDEAVRTYDSLVSTYSEYGYELLELPRGTVEERVRFVLRQIGVEANC